VQYRSRHLGEEREWWHWTEQLTSAVRALESAALGPEGHLLPFQAELDLVRSLAVTRPLYKAVAQHIEAQAPRYAIGAFLFTPLKRGNWTERVLTCVPCCCIFTTNGWCVVRGARCDF
jgi:hypothetical protein